MVTSLLELKPVELKNLSCDPCGSHIIDTFFESSTIGEKSREAFISRIKVCPMLDLEKPWSVESMYA